MIFFTADTHFGHGGALGLFRRPFTSVAAMDEAMIERWNARVGPKDEVWHLGDFAVLPLKQRTAERLGALLARLNGVKRLVAGNNDDEIVRALPGWTSVDDYREIELDGSRLVLCHYPLRSWRDDRRGAWNLHGHSHHRLKPFTRQRDAGVDGHDFAPVTLEELTRRRRPT